MTDARRLADKLWSWLNADGRAREAQLAQIRAAAGLGTDISLLRVFDVLVWMVGKGYAPSITTSAGPEPSLG